MARKKADGDVPTRRLDLKALPTWDQLPDIELYMDQVVSFMTRYFGPSGDGTKSITPSMVNNYVKIGLLPAPAKKRYTREHLAFLAIICTLKPVMPLASIEALLRRELNERPVEALYEVFRDTAQKTTRTAEDAFRNEEGGNRASALGAALRARAERDLAMAYYESEDRS